MAVAHFQRLTWRWNSGRWPGRSNLWYDSNFRWPRGGLSEKKIIGPKAGIGSNFFHFSKNGSGIEILLKKNLKKSHFVESSCLHLEILGAKRGSAKNSFLPFFWLCTPLEGPLWGQVPKEGCFTYFLGQNYTMRPFITFAVIWFAQMCMIFSANIS